MLLVILSALHVSFGGAFDAPPRPGVGPHLGVGREVQAPYGYLKFCLRRPDQCGLPGRTASEDAGEDVARRGGSSLDPRATALAPVDLAVAPPTLRLAQAPGAGVFDGAAGAAAPVALTPDRLRLLETVNRSINALIRPMSDEAAFGASNYWTLPLEDEHLAVGNCKHYALEKRKALVDAGWPPQALSLALVRTQQGELHAVLVVATDQADLVLDNLSPHVVDWRRVDYHWLVRQAPGEPLRWVAVPQA
jgi:predicted transglutaminase-like cysteine proteinase